MVERIYDTLKGILYNDMPKNAKDQVVIYDRPVLGWYFGDRDVKPSNLSLILFKSAIYDYLSYLFLITNLSNFIGILKLLIHYILP